MVTNSKAIEKIFVLLLIKLTNMMNSVQHAMQRQQLHSQVNNLDIIISKLTELINCNCLKTGSFMLSGVSNLGKTFHEIIVFDHRLPLPIDYIKQFAESYRMDITQQRNGFLLMLEDLEKNPQVNEDY